MTQDPYVFVPMHLCVGRHGRGVNMCTCAPRQMKVGGWWLSLLFSTLFLEIESLTEPGVHKFECTAQSRAFKGKQSSLLKRTKMHHMGVLCVCACVCARECVCMSIYVGGVCVNVCGFVEKDVGKICTNCWEQFWPWAVWLWTMQRHWYIFLCFHKHKLFSISVWIF